MMHYFHVPYRDVGEMPLRVVWRLMRQIPHLTGGGVAVGPAPRMTQEEGQNVLADILTKAGAVGVRGPKA